jgi:hypothetical protein
MDRAVQKTPGWLAYQHVKQLGIGRSLDFRG